MVCVAAIVTVSIAAGIPPVPVHPEPAPPHVAAVVQTPLAALVQLPAYAAGAMSAESSNPANANRAIAENLRETGFIDTWPPSPPAGNAAACADAERRKNPMRRTSHSERGRAAEAFPVIRTAE